MITCVRSSLIGIFREHHRSVRQFGARSETVWSQIGPGLSRPDLFSTDCYDTRVQTLGRIKGTFSKNIYYGHILQIKTICY